MSASARVYAILIKSLVAGRRADRRRKGIALSSSFNLAALQRQKHTYARGGGVLAKRRPRMELLLVGDRKMRPLSRLPHFKPCGVQRKTLQCHPFSRANNLKYLRCRTLKWSVNFDSDAISGNFFYQQLYS
jgi:hypothetical protein